MSARIPEIKIRKSDNYREIHVDGAFGGVNPNGAKIVVYTEEHWPELKTGGKPGQMELGHVTREMQAELHMSPVQFKSLLNWMKKHLNQYEQKFGEIKLESAEKGTSPESMYG